MLPSRRERHDDARDRRADVRRPERPRAGFTLVELIFSMSILSFAAIVFGGLILAISGAWDHSSALEEGRRQAQSTLARIKWMTQQAGTYRVSGQPTTLGIAVVPTEWGFYQAPTTLVVWSGGTNGGMNASGLKTRLPVASELVVYLPDPSKPSRFVEMTFPANTTTIDFRSASFATTIQSLLTYNARQSVPLCDRLHVTSQSGMPTIANTRFELVNSPADSEIAATTVGSQAWNNLSWGQGLVAADRGLRTTNVRIEMLLDPDPKAPTTSGSYATVFPFLGSASRQYVYQP